MEIPEVRRRLRAVIETARRQLAIRRERATAAARAYDVFLEQRAVPTFHVFASALGAEGHRFKVFTPAESVRLASDSSQDDYIELAFDVTLDPPRVVGRTNMGRGRRSISRERPIHPTASVEELTDEHVLDFLLAEIEPFVER